MMVKKTNQEKLGKKVGYLFGYFLFTTILFLILSISKKIPHGWGYFHVMGISLIIVLLGIIIGKMLR